MISLITRHKTHSIIFSPRHYTGLETYDSVEVTVSCWWKGRAEGNENGCAALGGSSKNQSIHLLFYIFQWKVNGCDLPLNCPARRFLTLEGFSCPGYLNVPHVLAA